MLKLFKYEVKIPSNKEKDFIDFMRSFDDEEWLPARQSWEYGKERKPFAGYYALQEGYSVYQNYESFYGITAKRLQQCYAKIGFPELAIMIYNGRRPLIQVMRFRHDTLEVIDTVTGEMAG